MSASNQVTLVSKEGEKFVTTEKAVERSKLIKNLLQDYPEEAEIPLTEVKASTLKKIKEYLEYYQDKEPSVIPKPLYSTDFKNNGISEWDVSFIDVGTDQVFDLLTAANYMDIQSLLDLAAAKVASLIKGLTPEYINNKFNLPNLDKEEEAKIFEETQWCMDNN
jgi:S-phase kinase-associated protein 1